MFDDINEANEHNPSAQQALEALAGVIRLGNTPGGQIVQRYEDAALEAGATYEQVQDVIKRSTRP